MDVYLCEPILKTKQAALLKLKLKEIRQKSGIDRFIIESVDLSLYIAFVQLDGVEHLIADNTGKPLKTTNLLSMQRQIKQFGQVESVLRQRSAYDEMVGRPSQVAADNTMEISLGSQPLPEWLN
ncbi:MAG: DUF6482 family protein [Luminiphilus sp.]|nr:DUF6482 family protein [Luminiphilus sp.]